MIANQDRNPLGGRWLALARWVLIILALFVIVITLIGIWQGYSEKRVLCNDSSQACQDHFQLNKESLQELGTIGLSLQAYAAIDLAIKLLLAFIYYSVAGLILWRRPNDRIALLVALWLILSTGLSSYPAAGRAFPALGFFAYYLPVLYWVTLGFFLALFPNGRFVPGWSKGYLLVWSILFLLPPSISERLPTFVPALGFISFFLFAIIVQVYRYRRVSTPLERQQTKWLMFGVVLTYGLGFLIPSLSLIIIPGLMEKAAVLYLVNWFIALLGSILPLSIGFAILRYRLWDIDVIIRRTLVYSALTALLGLVYFGGVTLLQAIFTAVSGQQSAVAIVISTLVIAALFNPLRHRVQEFVDRRFYRRKYNAELALASFSEMAREVVDLDGLTEKLLSVVQETVQPESVSLWLKPVAEHILKPDEKTGR
jgi:hypothetical protein